MGLDICLLRDPKLVQKGLDQPSDRKDLTAIYNIEEFEARQDGAETGLYSGTVEYRFRAGSYSGYNEYRRTLCEAALGVSPSRVWESPDFFSGKPFYEQINFADNEGAIGPKTAKKLSDDYWTARNLIFSRVKRGDTYFREVYDNFAQVFRDAAECNGFVIFT